MYNIPYIHIDKWYQIEKCANKWENIYNLNAYTHKLITLHTISTKTQYKRKHTQQEQDQQKPFIIYKLTYSLYRNLT